MQQKYKVGSIEEMQQFLDGGKYVVPGDLDLTSDITFDKPIQVKGEISSHNSIDSNGDMTAESIDTVGHIKVKHFIVSNLGIKAGKFIEAGGYIKAGQKVEAGQYIKTPWFICGK